MKAWEWRVTWILVVLVAIVWLSVQASQPCTLSFKVIKGMNFNQPYPIYQNGATHCTQVTDIHGNPFKN